MIGAGGFADLQFADWVWIFKVSSIGFPRGVMMLDGTYM